MRDDNNERKRKKRCRNCNRVIFPLGCVCNAFRKQKKTRLFMGSFLLLPAFLICKTIAWKIINGACSQARLFGHWAKGG